jgi:ACS family tartrate transporter-like MFS transporter
MPSSTAEAVPGVVLPTALDSALRKARWRLIPLIAVCYLVAYMDRSNISFAAQGMNRALHFSPSVYGLGAGLFFLSYGLCEIPSNTLLLRFGPRVWLSRIMFTWGLVAAGMMFVRTPVHFYGARLLLGCAEAGYFPGVVYYLSRWFPPEQRARTMSQFYVAMPVSTILMGALAGPLLGLNGRLGLAGWQWMFLVEAAPAVLLAFVVWFYLTDEPEQATWLSDAERGALVAELARDPHHASARHGSGLAIAARSGKVWVLGGIYFFMLGTSYALTFSLPQMVSQATGWGAGGAGNLVAGAGVAGAVGMLAVAWSSDKRQERRWHIAALCFVQAAMVLYAGLHPTGWSAAAALLASIVCWFSMAGTITVVLATVIPGKAAAIAIAIVNMMGIFGGFLGPYWMGWMREATGSYSWGVGSLCVPCVLAGVGILWVCDQQGEANAVVAEDVKVRGGRREM